MKNNLIDFNEYYAPEEVAKYEVFIGPKGEYYKVKTRYESEDNCTHYQWAEAYLENKNLISMLENKEINSKCKTPLQLLINYFGFIRYTHLYENVAYFNIPNRLYFGYTMSKEQIDSIYRLMYYNHDTVDEQIIKQLEMTEAEYELKIDRVFQKLKDRGDHHA